MAGGKLLAKEVNFPVPWGVLAAKTWGDPCASPVLMLHGIQDNAGSFDRLIPLLPAGFYYICLDLPGHGLSTRLPKGLRLDFIEYVLSVNRVVRQLSWKTFILIGHSLGGQIGQYYAAMYPEQVLKLVVLDAYGPTPVPIEDFLSFMRKMHEQLLEIESKMLDSEPPSYTKEVALDKMVANRRMPITREAAERIMERNLKTGKNGFYFSLDQRLKLSVLVPLSHKQQIENYKNISCPFLLVVTKRLYKALSLDEPTIAEKTFLGTFIKNPKFEIALVEGNHDVHNDNPEIVAPHVVNFMLRKKSML